MGAPMRHLMLIAASLLLLAAVGCGNDAGPSDTPQESPSASGNQDVVTDYKAAPPDKKPIYDDKGRELDHSTGLVKADGWQLILANCVACHSPKQFLRQRGTKATWHYIIDWMQETQGLWEFPPGDEDKMVEYLATYYGPEGEYRRAPIPATLMPPNPYGSEISKQVEEMKKRGELPTKGGDSSSKDG